jgi:HAD superfamily hydrolase (TIGR01509 family)
VAGSFESRLAAIIFDMDGVLADTEPIQEEALGAFLALRGKSLSPTENAAMIGLDYRAFWAALIEQLGLDESIEECVRGYEPILLPRLIGLQAAPGAYELVSALRVANVPLAVASSSFRAVVEMTLGAIGLRDAFKVVVSGEDVRMGKPAPDIYLLAAQRLRVKPDRCVAVEDSPYGVRAATAAGMPCLGVATSCASRDQLHATRTVRSLAEVTPADLAALAT